MTADTLSVHDAVFGSIGLQTTGLEPEWGHRIYEIAVIVSHGLREAERFSALLNPGRTIEPAAATPDMPEQDILRAASMEVVLPVVDRLLVGRVLLSYNTTFTMGFLRSEYRSTGREMPSLRTVDVMAMARRFLPSLGRYPLDLVAQTLQISSDARSRALADAETTWSVFRHFSAQLSAHGIDSVEELEAMSRPTSPLSEALRRDKLRIIERARDQGRRVHLIYRALDHALTERDVTPLEIRTDTGKAQLQGFCHLRNAERTFNVDAIQDIEIIAGPGSSYRE